MKDMAVISALHDSTFAIILLKWTALFVLAWIVHGFLRKRDARWRVILWRSVLGIGLLLPLLSFVPLPLWKLAVLPKIPAQELSATTLKPSVEPKNESAELTILQSSRPEANSPGKRQL